MEDGNGEVGREGFWRGVAGDGSCSESELDDLELSVLENRKRGMIFQFVCSDTFSHSLSSFFITSSLPLSTNHQRKGLTLSLDFLYLRLTLSTS